MTLLEEVKQICNRLTSYGWRSLLSAHGLDILANDLRSELLKELPTINRTIDGFQDFAEKEKEVSNPAYRPVAFYIMRLLHPMSQKMR